MPYRRRAGYPRRQLGESRRRFMRDNALLLTAFGLCVATAIWAVHFALDGYLLGLAQGLSAAFVFGAVRLLQLGASGSMNQLTGAWGEDMTRDILSTARRRRWIHGHVDNIEVQGGDIDHLVATSRGWLAIDSKWHGATARRSVIIGDAASARRAAWKARSVLRSLGLAPEVTPLVVVWGGLKRAIPNGQCAVDGVVVLAGYELKRYLRSLPSGGLDEGPSRRGAAGAPEIRERVRPQDFPGRDRKLQTQPRASRRRSSA